MRRNRRHLSLALAAAGIAAALAGALPSERARAQSCTTIGGSTFCGTRGSHNTVGNTIIFNNGPAGRRVGNFAVVGTPPRTEVIRGAKESPLAPPGRFSAIAGPKTFAGSGPFYDPRIAALRAQSLALETQQPRSEPDLTPAEKAAGANLPPALLRALALARQAREKAAAGTAGAPPSAE